MRAEIYPYITKKPVISNYLIPLPAFLLEILMRSRSTWKITINTAVWWWKLLSLFLYFVLSSWVEIMSIVTSTTTQTWKGHQFHPCFPPPAHQWFEVLDHPNLLSSSSGFILVHILMTMLNWQSFVRENSSLLGGGWPNHMNKIILLRFDKKNKLWK